MKEIKYPKDVNHITVAIGDKVCGEGFITFQDGFKIDLSPIVTVRLKGNLLYFGGLSASSFNRFKIIKK